MSYYPGSHIKYKVNVLLNLSYYATKKELEHAIGVDVSDLAAKKILVLWSQKLINEKLINWLMFKIV